MLLPAVERSASGRVEWRDHVLPRTVRRRSRGSCRASSRPVFRRAVMSCAAADRSRWRNSRTSPVRSSSRTSDPPTSARKVPSSCIRTRRSRPGTATGLRRRSRGPTLRIQDRDPRAFAGQRHRELDQRRAAAHDRPGSIELLRKAPVVRVPSTVAPPPVARAVNPTLASAVRPQRGTTCSTATAALVNTADSWPSRPPARRAPPRHRDGTRRADRVVGRGPGRRDDVRRDDGCGVGGVPVSIGAEDVPDQVPIREYTRGAGRASRSLQRASPRYAVALLPKSLASAASTMVSMCRPPADNDPGGDEPPIDSVVSNRSRSSR